MKQHRILFFVPDHIDAIGIHHELITRLKECLSSEADVSMATSGAKKDVIQPSDYDIIHFFGCWSNSACRLAARAYRHNTPYLLTPLGALQPWEMVQHRRSTLFNKQHQLTSKAAAVHVCGKLEQETFTRLGWNKRQEIIKNPILTSQISFEETARQLTNLYQKILDSNARLLLSETGRQMIGSLLQLGANKNTLLLHDHIAKLQQTFETLTDDDWRQIFIYAQEERITIPLTEGICRLQRDVPEVNTDEINRFEPDIEYPAGDLKADALLSKSLLLRNKVKDAFANRGSDERALSLLILNLNYELSRHKAPLLHLVNLYQFIRFTNLDEDMAKDMVHELGLDDFAGRLMTVMENFLGLTEGFMPFFPKNDKHAEHLLTELTKFGTYK